MTQQHLEFDLFEFETKLRDLVSDLVTPVINKALEHDKLLSNLIFANKKNEEFLNRFENTFHKAIVRCVPVDEFNKKINELSSDKKTDDSHFSLQFDSLATRVDHMNHQFADLISRINLIEEIQKNLKQQSETQYKSFWEFKENVSANLLNTESIVTTNLQSNSEMIENICKDIKLNSASIAEINGKGIPEVYVCLQKQENILNEVNYKIKELFDVRVHPYDLKKMENKLEFEIKKAYQENSAETHNIKEYLDKMLRIEISCGVSDTLFQILDMRQIKKLIPVVESQLNGYNEEKVEEKVEIKTEPVFTDFLRSKTMKQNKNIEEKINFAKEKLITDEKSPLKSLNQLNLKKLEFDESDENSPTKLNSDTTESNTKREEDTKRIEAKDPVLSTILTEKSFDENSFDPVSFQEQLQQLALDLKSMEAIKEEALATIKDSTNKLIGKVLESKQEFLTYVSILTEECKQLGKQRIKDINDVNTSIEAVYKEISEKMAGVEVVDEKISKITEVVNKNIESAKIIQSLMASDEDDRQGLQLTGYSETKPKSNGYLKPKLSVTLKPECLSCTGQNPLIYSSFKMACLNYYPSDVKYNSKSYPRKFLIDKLGEYLKAVEDDVESKEIVTERLKPTFANDESSKRFKSHSRVRTISRHILDFSTSKLCFDPETPLRSRKTIRSHK